VAKLEFSAPNPALNHIIAMYNHLDNPGAKTETVSTSTLPSSQTFALMDISFTSFSRTIAASRSNENFPNTA